MGKAKPRKQNASQDQFHVIKVGSVKKNKHPKFKNTPMGKIALINNSKVENKNMKHVPSQKNVQKGFVDAKNKNQNLLQTSKNNVKQLKQGSSNMKQNFSNKSQSESFQGKFIFNPKKMLEQFDDFNSDSDEETKEDVNLNKMDETFEGEDSDSDIPDIFGKTLKDESDEDDEDFEEEEEQEDEEEGDISDEEEIVECKGVKMFEGIKSKIKNANENQENDNDENDESDEDLFESDKNDEDNEDESKDEDEDDNDDNDDDDDDHDYLKTYDHKNKKRMQNIKNVDQIDISRMETDEEDEQIQNIENLDRNISLTETEDDDDEDDDDDDEDEDEDEDDDDMDEEMGLKALLEKSIADDDDDEDFNEEDEDDDDDDISSEDEDDEENDDAVIQMKTITKKKAMTVNKKDTQMEKEKNPTEEQDQFAIKSVLVENISRDTTIKKIKKLFSQYGVLKRVILEPFAIYKTDKSFKKSATTATKTLEIPDYSISKIPKVLSLQAKLIYETKESALNAVKAMHGMMVDGNYLIVQTIAKFNAPYDVKKTVFITNLKKSVELNEIWKAFHKCGNIDCINLKRNEQTKLCEYGYIHFFTEEAASSALKLCNVAKVMERPVIVLKLDFAPNDKYTYRDDRYIRMCRDVKFEFDVRQNEKTNPLVRKLSDHHEDDKPSKRFKNNLKELLVPDTKHEKNVKKHKKQQEVSEEKKSAFQGQKVYLKNKKKNKLNKKRKMMMKKLTAKSAKI